VTDQELILAVLRQVGWIVAEHLESGANDPDEAITRVIAVLDTEELAERDQPVRAYAGAAGGEIASRREPAAVHPNSQSP
jgi:hypothetical protein